MLAGTYSAGVRRTAFHASVLQHIYRRSVFRAVAPDYEAPASPTFAREPLPRLLKTPMMPNPT